MNSNYNKNKLNYKSLKSQIKFQKKPSAYFKSPEESENFYKNILLEEMNVSNNNTIENIMKLLNLYFKGIEIYQNTPESIKLNYFIEKSRKLLNNPKIKKIFTNNKKIHSEIDSIDGFKSSKELHSQIRGESEKKISPKKNNNEIKNFKRLKTLTESINNTLEESNNSKKKLVEINNEYNKINDDLKKTCVFLDNEISKQESKFKEKLKNKRVMKKCKTLKEPKIDIETSINPIIEEKQEYEKQMINCKSFNNIYHNKNQNFDFIEINNKKKYSMDFTFNKIKIISFKKSNVAIENINDKNIKKEDLIIENLRKIIYENIAEYKIDIMDNYCKKTINSILQLMNEECYKNEKIYNEYQKLIKNYYQKKMDATTSEEIEEIDEDIKSLQEEQMNEIQKNNNHYEKLVYEEISNFKSLGYSKKASFDEFDELNMLKNKVRNSFYSEYLNILNK